MFIIGKCYYYMMKIYPDSGGTVPVCRDCFADNSLLPAPYFTDGETIWYVRQESIYHYKVIALDPESFSEQTVYEYRSSDNLERREMLFGLGAYLPAPKPESASPVSFFVHDGLLVMQEDRGIFAFDISTGRETRLYNGKTRNLVCTAGAVYFTDSLSDICRCNLKTQVCEKLKAAKSDLLYAAEDGLYCRAVRGGFCFVSPDGGQITELPDFDEAHPERSIKQ